MNLHVLKRKELSSLLGVTELDSVMMTSRKPSVEALDLSRSDHHGSSNRPKKKHKVIVKMTLHPQRGDTFKELTQEIEPPLIAALAPPRGQSSKSDLRKRESRPRSILD